MPVSYGNIQGQEPSTVTFVVGTVKITRGSTVEHQEIMVIGDPISSLAIARVLDAAPASTEFGQVVRIADPSTGPFAISSIAGVTKVAQNSTVWETQAIQSGPWTVRANLSSTSADNPVNAAQAGTWTVNLGSHLQSTAVQPAASSAISVRLVGGVSSAVDNPVRPVFSSTHADNPVSMTRKPVWGAKTTITVTLASLTNTSKRETTAFFSTSFSDYSLRFNTRGASTGFVNVYVYESLGDTTYSGGATGADAAFSNVLTQVRFLTGFPLVAANTAAVHTCKLSDILWNPPSAGGLIFENQTGGTLSSSNGDHVIEFQGMT